MNKLTAGSIAAVATVAMVAITFSAARADQTSPGSPGTPSCRGQTTAYLAQAAKNGNLDDALHVMGFAGNARDHQYTVPELHELVDEFCMSLPIP